MNAKYNFSLIAIVMASLIPFCAHGDVVDDVGHGIQEVGKGFGNAAEDIGAGFSNAFEGAKPDAADTAITTQAQSKIKELENKKQIAADYDLTVRTNKGIVTVSGTVSNELDISVVKAAIGKIQGVKSVNVDIEVKNG